ncbi:cyclase family protein [Cryobacterium sp. GrIS_2_6]|uniref:cyclase family protein n=1 Tax=Cryobacterium sp. GrIS_2_6 TaxID=3162785 RepID=UPI002E0B6381|nr:kynurenine formamidase [Cryobacterium psychrotolerans]
MSTAHEHPLDRANPLAAIEAAAAAVRNWGRWRDEDVLGTLNFIDDAKRAEAAGLIRRGTSFSLAQSFDGDGPQNGWRRRTNPVHTMLDTGADAALGNQGFPHGLGGADDVVSMPLQASTQWDGLGHIFDRGLAWNGRPAETVVTSEGDLVTGIEHTKDSFVSRGVLLDVGALLGASLGTPGELPDGYAITPDDLDATIAAQGPSAAVGRGDLLLVRTGRLARARREGWKDYAGGPSAGLSFTTAGWLHSREVAGVATDTWGFEVRPNEFDDAFQPLHQIAIPNMGLSIGELWDLDALAGDCSRDGRFDFFLVAAPIPFTGAVGAPVNPIAIK